MSASASSRPASDDGGHPGLARDLTLFDAINLVIGTIIGSGIFLVPSEIARAVHTSGWMLAVWVIGGVLTMLGALSLAELGAAMPEAGGIYTFISRGFGQLWGFLCGWMLFTVATSGSIATLGAAFPIYLGAFVPLTPTTTKIAGLVVIALLTWINIVGVKNGARVGNFLTACKVGGLVVMVVAIFLLPAHADPAAAAAAPLPSGPVPLAAVGVALVAVLWAYEGWHDVTFAAGEMHNAQRNFPRAIIGGVGIVIAVYLLANLAYLKVLTPAEIAGSDRVALDRHDARHGRVGRQAADRGDPLLDPRRDERPHPGGPARLLPDGEGRALHRPRARASTRSGARRSRRCSSRDCGRASSSSSSEGSRSSSRTSSSAAGSSTPSPSRP